nr:hypothetical protein [uncultured bacterium]
MNGNGKLYRATFFEGRESSAIARHDDGRLILLGQGLTALPGMRHWVHLKLSESGTCYIATAPYVPNDQQVIQDIEDRETDLRNFAKHCLAEQERLASWNAQLEQQAAQQEQRERALAKLEQRIRQANKAIQEFNKIRDQVVDIAELAEKLSQQTGRPRFAANLLEGIPQRLEPIR